MGGEEAADGGHCVIGAQGADDALGLLPDGHGLEVGLFLDLGGDSLSAAMVVSLLREDPSTAAVTVRDVYEQRTVRALGELASRRWEQAVPGASRHEAAPASDARSSRPALVTAIRSVSRPEKARVVRNVRNASLSTDSGATFPDTIRNALPNSGSYDWTVPNQPTLTARVRAVAHEDLVRTHVQHHVEIARRPAMDARLAFAGEPHLRAVVHPGRDVDLHLALRLLVSLVAALRAGRTDHLACAGWHYHGRLLFR